MAYDNDGSQDVIDATGAGCLIAMISLIYAPIIVIAIAISYRLCLFAWWVIAG